jgi:plasmid stabilization system protein ParE
VGRGPQPTSEPRVAVKVRFRAEAVADVSLAREWYEAKSPGLGGAFVESLEKIVDLVVDVPEAFPEIAVGLRRALLSRFPYALYYRFDGDRDDVEVIACLHTRQSSSRWRTRG